MPWQRISKGEINALFMVAPNSQTKNARNKRMVSFLFGRPRGICIYAAGERMDRQRNGRGDRTQFSLSRGETEMDNANYYWIGVIVLRAFLGENII
jgi:hypothetical protein